jgi:hypothetical protein
MKVIALVHRQFFKLSSVVSISDIAKFSAMLTFASAHQVTNKIFLTQAYNEMKFSSQGRTGGFGL